MIFITDFKQLCDNKNLSISNIENFKNINQWPLRNSTVFLDPKELL